MWKMRKGRIEAPADTEAVPEQIIVKFEENVGAAAKADVRRAEGLEKENSRTLWNEFSEGLTTLQREVAAMVVQGLSDCRIAQVLYLSERTIEKHVSKTLRKLELASRTEIAAWATEQRIIAPNPD